ncbi:hypothetical protein [Chryseobacterium sp. ISL-6]|uniref:hypothetical protein n=1 Tax=Chryseobacterium sp. ISL-6 TaxID=2819143 RepID=UPI001BEB21E3|nr:hypothetical protein [Chryseobacterium sp. ISL-6]MBT2620580.1 hypothetical protein [Chryseobacterium sp. ISL-6]
MKKTNIFLFSLAITASCSKGSDKIVIKNSDSVNQNVQTTTDTIKRSIIQQIPEREVTDSVITHEIDLLKLPMEVDEELYNENQKLVLQLMNVKKSKISGRIIPESGQMNIRFNNIALNGKSIDGPFGLDFDYDLEENGRYNIIIGKSLMASGSQIGKFKIVLK